jgi:hypothetical protein
MRGHGTDACLRYTYHDILGILEKRQCAIKKTRELIDVKCRAVTKISIFFF